MAEGAVSPDSLSCLRQAIAAGKFPITTTSAEPASASDAEQNLALATHLQFIHDGPVVIALDAPTRFETSGSAIDLRSIYFAWLRKDDSITDYIAATQRLNEELAKNGSSETIQNLVFAEKIELITWLEGASEENEYIKPLAQEVAAAQAQASGAASVAAGTTGGVATVPSGTAPSRQGRTIDPRLREIYNSERGTGDRNTILRGIKPTDFSHVRKHAEAYLGRNRGKSGRSNPAPSTAAPLNPALIVSRKPGRRPEPIILLSPSASSLLRMSNIKSFLDDGIYTPPDSTSSNANLLHISRLIPSIDPQRPLRFVVVDTPEQFKPDYWSRLAAVFTTGQSWQFKSYKWQSPPDLFTHALGVYVGWRGEDVPAAVRGWGRGVTSTQIDKWNAHQSSSSRWRDREVVEGIWSAIEESMKTKGWNKDGSLTR